MMTGVVKVGTAAGQMVLPLVAALLMTVVGWRYTALALGYAGCRVPADRRVLDVGLRRRAARPPGSAGTPGSAGSREHPAQPRVLDPVPAAQFLFFPSLVTVPLHIAVHGIDLGMTRTTAATLLTVIGGVSIVGRLTVGTFVDRIGGRNAYILSLAPLVAGSARCCSWSRRTGRCSWPSPCTASPTAGLFTVVCAHRGRALRHPRPRRDLRRHRVLRHPRRGRRPGRGGPGLRCHRQLRVRVHRACRDGRRRTGARAHVAEARAEVARSVLSRYTVPESLVERCCECALYTNAAFVDDVS